MSELLDPLREIHDSSSPRRARGLMARYCSLVHWISVTPFPAIWELLDGIKRKIAQIVYIYHGNEENSPGVYRKSSSPIWTAQVVNMNEPSFYWLVQHTNGEVSIVCLLRKPWFTDIEMLQGMLNHFDSLSTGIEQSRNYPEWSIIFSWVGILPGLINRLAVPKWNNLPKLQIPPRVLVHNSWKNANSAGFVAEAWRKIGQTEFSNQWSLNQLILGHKGTLWEAVLRKLEIDPENNTSETLLIDKSGWESFPKIPDGDILVLDVTVWSLGTYMEALSRISNNSDWSKRKILWINEAYPPPMRSLIDRAVGLWIHIVHIVWVEWKIIPSLTDVYTWGIPCCMALFSQWVDGVIFRRLIPIDHKIGIARPVPQLQSA